MKPNVVSLHKQDTQSYHIANIKIGTRHRKEMGDLSSMAKSIEEQGLLQPIGISSDGLLVFGQRRLLACQNYLGWTEIDVRIVNVTSIAHGEMHENEVRKDFTASERVAIYETIENHIAERRGRPTKNVANSPQLSEIPKGTKTRDIAAKHAGFGGSTTAREAKAVVDKGTPELVEAMDKEEISIKAANMISAFPVEEQNEKLIEHIQTKRQPKPREKEWTDEEIKEYHNGEEPATDGEIVIMDLIAIGEFAQRIDNLDFSIISEITQEAKDTINNVINKWTKLKEKYCG